MDVNSTGKISAQLNSRRLEQLCIANVPSYDPKRFKVVAARAYAGEEFILTVFAADSFHQPLFGESSPVKKFKITGLEPADFMNCLDNWNFTLFEENHKEDEIVVINK